MLELIRRSNKIERYLFALNVTATLVNIALALTDGWASVLNWFVAGVCIAMALSLIFAIKWRLLLERQDTALTAAIEMVEMLMAPDHYETQLRRLFDKAKADGVIPPDVELFKVEQPKLH